MPSSTNLCLCVKNAGEPMNGMPEIWGIVAALLVGDTLSLHRILRASCAIFAIAYATSTTRRKALTVPVNGMLRDLNRYENWL